MMEEPEGRPLAEDFSIPVTVQGGVDHATPPDWSWRRIGTSQPNKAIFHLTHSDVGQVIVDVLRPSDSPPEAPFAIAKDIPIIIIDSLDKYWAAESRTQLPLHGLRVPVDHDTKKGAKRALAADLAAQLRLLLLLSSSYQQEMAPQLKANLTLLSKYLAPRSSSTDEGT
jgi:hypothetical protein